HVVTYLHWIDQRVVGFLHAEAEPICWPLAPDCHALRVLSAAGVTRLLRAYFAAAVGVGVLFAWKPLVPWAYASLITVNVVKLAVMLMDYRLRMNQHYMAFAATFVYLLIPGKRPALRVLISLFYFWPACPNLTWGWTPAPGFSRRCGRSRASASSSRVPTWSSSSWW